MATEELVLGAIGERAPLVSGGSLTLTSDTPIAAKRDLRLLVTMRDDRGTVVAHAERLMTFARKERELRESGQSTMFDLFGSQVATPMPGLELDPRPVAQDVMLGWEKELLGIYISEHPFRAAAPGLAQYTSHTLADLTMELAGQTVTVGGLVTRVQARATREQSVLGIALEQFWRDDGGLPVGDGGDDQADESLGVPTRVAVGVGEPV